MKKVSIVSSALVLTASAFLAGCQETASTTGPIQVSNDGMAARTSNPTLVLSAPAAVSSNGDYGTAYAAKFLVDGSFSTYWVSSMRLFSATSTANVQLQYGSAVTVTSYKMVGRYDALKGRLPKAWVIQGSNDGSALVTDAVASTKWKTVDTRSNMDTLSQWKAGSPAYQSSLNLTVATPGSYTRYRLCVSQINGKNNGSNVTDLLEMTLSAKATATFTSNGDFSSEYSPAKAFDSSYVGYSDHWISANHAKFQGPANIQIAYSMPVPVDTYTIVGRFDALKDRLPKSWVLQGSNSASASAYDAATSGNWTQLDAQTNVTTWVAGGEKNGSTFGTLPTWMTCKRFPLKTKAVFSKYRLCVSAVSGSTVVDIHEIQFNRY